MTSFGTLLRAVPGRLKPPPTGLDLGSVFFKPSAMVVHASLEDFINNGVGVPSFHSVVAEVTTGVIMSLQMPYGLGAPERFVIQ
jgi:hypothetical protein